MGEVNYENLIATTRRMCNFEDPIEALKMCDELLSHDTRETSYWGNFCKAKAYYRLEEYDECCICSDISLNYAETNMEIIYAMWISASAEQHQNKTDKIIDKYNDIIKLSEDVKDMFEKLKIQASAYNNIGCFNKDVKLIEKATDMYKESLQYTMNIDNINYIEVMIDNSNFDIIKLIYETNELKAYSIIKNMKTIDIIKAAKQFLHINLKTV